MTALTPRLRCCMFEAMRICSVITPFSDRNLRLASQLGVTDITTHYHGPNLADLQAVQRRVEEFGLRISVIEGRLPIEAIKRGSAERDAEIEEMKRLIGNLATAGVPIICYNFMAGTDWVRTTLDAKERGGALVTGFDLAAVNQAVSLREAAETLAVDSISAEELWDNLEYFLERVLPAAEDAGVILAMHPDDPPLDVFLGRARIMNSVENFERLVQMAPSTSNAICFCQGTFAEIGVDIPMAIRRLGPYIRYVHFRDIRGTRERFVETFHDNGPTDMVAAMRAYREIGFDGPMRPTTSPNSTAKKTARPAIRCWGDCTPSATCGD